MAGNTDKTDRLAAALRANLARRKGQARARKADAEARAQEPAAADPAENGENPPHGQGDPTPR